MVHPGVRWGSYKSGKSSPSQWNHTYRFFQQQLGDKNLGSLRSMWPGVGSVSIHSTRFWAMRSAPAGLRSELSSKGAHNLIKLHQTMCSLGGNNLYGEAMSACIWRGRGWTCPSAGFKSYVKCIGDIGATPGIVMCGGHPQILNFCPPIEQSKEDPESQREHLSG